MPKVLTVGWKVASLDLSIASLRYRAILPLVALEEFHGIGNKIFSRVSETCLNGLDVLVFVKSFSIEDYFLAQEASELNIPIVFDLCDNIFVGQYGTDRRNSPADIFLLIGGLAKAIVVPTEPLAEVVRKQIGENSPIYIIPDGISNKAKLAQAKGRLVHVQRQENRSRLKNKINLSSWVQKANGQYQSRSIISNMSLLLKTPGFLLRKLFHYPKTHSFRLLLSRTYNFSRGRLRNLSNRYHSNVKHFDASKPEKTTFSDKGKSATLTIKKILWFGNHGEKYANSGMLDLLLIQDSLEKIANELSVELVVVSNNFKKFQKYIRSLAIPSRYIEWNADQIEEQIRVADVIVIPNSLNSFSICKSANRAVLALSVGTPVVATATSAMQLLKECITLDDFKKGIQRYLTDGVYSQEHVRSGQKLIGQLFGQEEIGRLWNNLINDVITVAHAPKVSKYPEWIVVIHLPQDLDLIRPILSEADGRGISCVVWVSLTAMKRWPQMADEIRSLRFMWRVLPDKPNKARLFPSSAYALLTASETNLNPHQFGHQLTKLANSSGLYTATLQHGFENVGLSWSDEIHDIVNIRFSARQIFTWGHLETLHPDIPQQTLNKCFPIGCPKPAVVVPTPLRFLESSGEITIGIFENLHWHRYSDEYRKFFLDGLEQVAKIFPNIMFLVKPHNAGMWLTSRYQGNKPFAKNLVIVDPMDPKWSSVTTPNLLGELTAVITTPSTVALDAARVKKPVALVGHGMKLGQYDPLYLIQSLQDWEHFILQVLKDDERKILEEKSNQFVNRVLLPGNAAGRIVEKIVSNNPKRFYKVHHNILITGGLGFIGSRLVAELLKVNPKGRIWVLDNLNPQVHGENAQWPINSDRVKFIFGDVANKTSVNSAVACSKPELVYHLAAETGTGQSHQEVARYCEVNVLGTANLIEAIRSQSSAVTKKVVLAASRAVYGEGGYEDATGRIYVGLTRQPEAMAAGNFQVPLPEGAQLPAKAVASHSGLSPAPASIYASTKLMQEHLLKQASDDGAWQTVILRFQNVYGPGQSLRNPYTGVLSIFARQLLEGKKLAIFEDGLIARDFVYVDDVVDALVKASQIDLPNGSTLDIGTGEVVSILDVARLLMRNMSCLDEKFSITGQFRVGDIRHACADIRVAHERLGWKPRISVEEGLELLAKWVRAEFQSI